MHLKVRKWIRKSEMIGTRCTVPTFSGRLGTLSKAGGGFLA